MPWLLLLVGLILAARGATPAAFGAPTPPPWDVSAITVGGPTVVSELDLGKLKGELRRLAWSPEGTEFSVRTSEGDNPDDRVHFYTVAAEGGAVQEVTREPEWATTYWAFKSDRSAPGLNAVMIDVDQRRETQKVGTGSAGAAAGGDRAGGGTVMSADNIDREAQNQKQNVVNLMLYGEVISRFVNERPVPGAQFSWGPSGTGAIAFVDAEGRLFLLDQQKHKKAIAGVKGATLPAWSVDGTKLAYVQKIGRRKYALMSVAITRASRSS